MIFGNIGTLIWSYLLPTENWNQDELNNNNVRDKIRSERALGETDRGRYRDARPRRRRRRELIEEAIGIERETECANLGERYAGVGRCRLNVKQGLRRALERAIHLHTHRESVHTVFRRRLTLPCYCAVPGGRPFIYLQ